MKKAAAFLIFALCVPLTVSAQTTKVGKTGFAFLKIGVGGRSAALANANFADVKGADASYWNPANLRDARNEIFFAHSEWLLDVKNDFVAAKFNGWGASWAFSLQMQNIGGIEQRTIATAEPIGELTARDVAIGLSYARALNSQLDMGLTFKYIGSRILNYAANGLAVDFGAKYRLDGIAGLSLAASVHNLGSADEMLSEKINLPTLLRAGLAYEPLQNLQNHRLKVFVGYEALFDAGSGFGAGIEFVANQLVALRAGYRFNEDSRHFSGGIGLERPGYQLDYAYTPFDYDLGETHNISLSVGL